MPSAVIIQGFSAETWSQYRANCSHCVSMVPKRNQEECVNSLLRRSCCCFVVQCDARYLSCLYSSNRFASKGILNDAAFKNNNNEKMLHNKSIVTKSISVSHIHPPPPPTPHQPSFFPTSLLQGWKRRLHQFGNDELPFINPKVREGWRFAAGDKVGGNLDIIHHWHRGTQSKSLLLYSGKKEGAKTLII